MGFSKVEKLTLSFSIAKITTVFLDNCNLIDLPVGLNHAANLTTLVLVNNKFTTIPQSIISITTLTNLRKRKFNEISLILINRYGK